MYRIFSFIVSILAIAPAAYADIYTKSSDVEQILLAQTDSVPEPRELTPIEAADTLIIIPERFYTVFEPGYFGPLIFDSYHYMPAVSIENLKTALGESKYFDSDADDWLEDLERSSLITNNARQQYFVNYPRNVRYNIANMSRVPSQLRATVEVDPSTSKIILKEIPVEAGSAADELALDIKEKRWLHNFSASIPFSQAFLSPNWYQGGNNNLNMLAQILWSVKLNEKFYPKLLFEMTTQYKLGINSAPDDSIRSYSISDDLFQLNAKFGYKALSSWYYSTNLTFKTQLLNNYKSNTNDLRAAFLSPGELNIGVGMTYSKTTKRVEFNASLNPLSYNLKTCINTRLDETTFDIKEGHKTVSQFGSNAELNFAARLTWNIRYTSRLFLFTDYSYVQGDWQNTLSFDINRFLSTQFFWHIRYDTSTDRVEGTDWHRFQCKEIFTFGLSYRFSTV
ncbi:MAG: DUF3078 domain-containing protein [Bacteroides sp.]|nr:DUF3078 domain-containing protein [Bacteroides sp.]